MTTSTSKKRPLTWFRMQMPIHFAWLILLLLQCKVVDSRYGGNDTTVSIGNPVSSPLHSFLAVNETVVSIDVNAAYEFILDPQTGAHVHRDRASSFQPNLRGGSGAGQTKSDDVRSPSHTMRSGSSSSERYIVRIHEHVPHEQFERHLKDAFKFDYRRRLEGRQGGGGGGGGLAVARSQLLYARDLDADVDDLVKIHHRYAHVFHGAAVSGVSRALLEGVYGVWNVHEDVIFRIGVDWNIDRIDQASLPLSNSYTFSYTGAGTDIYVIDTGLDTTHQEFDSVAQGAEFPRTVANVFDAINSGPLRANNDDNSHGTHCAGTAAGRSVGSAPGANVYGLKVLDASGSGASSNVIAAMDEVKRLHTATPGKRSVASLSLGGPCAGGDTKCDSTNDPTMSAVNSLVNAGVVVVAAAGNDYANSCYTSPGAAAAAIGVAATSKTDKFASFSNYGECVDILAPGVNIKSACTQLYPGCSSKNYYMLQSGTSMAAPLVAGVAAQLLQKHTTATPLEIHEYMLCAASSNQISYDGGQAYLTDVPNFDTATKNLLARVPLLNQDFSTCSLGAGCVDSCSGHGVCMLNVKASVSTDKRCKCFNGYYTDNCSLMQEARPARACSNTKTWFKMYSWGSVGWGGAYYAIKDSSTGLVVDNAFDGIYRGAFSGIRYHCLPDGCYNVVTTVGPSATFSYSIGWNMNGIIGGTPWDQTYCVTSPDASNAPVFTLQCNSGQIVDLVLKDSYGDGWQGIAYRIYHQTLLKYTHGGYLPYGDNRESTTKICLAWGCSKLMMLGTDEFPAEVGWTFNGIPGDWQSHATTCVYPPPSPAPSAMPSAVPSPAPTATPTAAPSEAPTVILTASPSAAPTAAPSTAPSAAPSEVPTMIPTALPSAAPTAAPSEAPTVIPTASPSAAPTATPTTAPSMAPSAAPSEVPTMIPTALPTTAPSTAPSDAPTLIPPTSPTAAPSTVPSEVPTVIPTTSPTAAPSEVPTVTIPSPDPSAIPSVMPTPVPSIMPLLAPTPLPSRTPIAAPSLYPTMLPSLAPRHLPTKTPSFAPTPRPSVSMRPTRMPTLEPSFAPSNELDTPAPTFKVVSISIRLKVDHLLREADMNPDMRLVMRMAMADVLSLPLDSILEPVFKMIDDGVDSASPAVRRMLAGRPVIEIGVILVAAQPDNTAPSANGWQSVFEKNSIDKVISDVGLAVASGAMQLAFLHQSVILAAQIGQSADAIVENVIFTADTPVVLNRTPTQQPTAFPKPATVFDAGKKEALPIAAIVGGVAAAVVLLALIRCVLLKRSRNPPFDQAGDFSSIKHVEQTEAAADLKRTVPAAVVLSKNKSVLPKAYVDEDCEDQLVFPDL